MYLLMSHFKPFWGLRHIVYHEIPVNHSEATPGGASGVLSIDILKYVITYRMLVKFPMTPVKFPMDHGNFSNHLGNFCIKKC